MATTKDGDLLCGCSDRVLGSTACNKGGNSAYLSMPSAEFTYDARDFAEEWTKGTENAVQYKDTHTYVCIYTHTLHLVSVGLTQVHPNDYNYT